MKKNRVKELGKWMLFVALSPLLLLYLAFLEFVAIIEESMKAGR